MNNKDVQQINFSFDQYLNFVYNWTLINSLAFNPNLKQVISDDLYINCFDQSRLLELLRLYLYGCKNLNNFDEDIKNNLYFLIGYIAELDKTTDKYKKNDMINDMKILLNNTGNNNYDFIRNQIILRDFGNLNYNKNLKKLNKVSDDNLNEFKNIYYNSIGNDSVILSFLMLNNGKFYNDGYKEVFLTKEFYRSVNVFLNDHYCLFCNETDFLNKIDFCFNKIIEFVECSSDTVILNADLDEEFFDIAEVTKKLVKKVAKRFQ